MRGAKLLLDSTDMGDVLDQMNREAGFPASIVTGANGLLVASSVKSGDNPEKQSAVVAKLLEAGNLVQTQLSMGSTDELAFHAEDGRRLICRPFHLNGQNLILAVVVPRRDQAYRRATNRTISLLRTLWNTTA